MDPPVFGADLACTEAIDIHPEYNHPLPAAQAGAWDRPLAPTAWGIMRLRTGKNVWATGPGNFMIALFNLP